MVLLAIIGKRFAAAGLHDIVVESGTVGLSSAESMLSGKHYIVRRPSLKKWRVGPQTRN